MKYPEGLVHEYGAKAGLLMYVAQELPDIPQAPFVAGGINEPRRSIRERVLKSRLDGMLLYRSSAVEELDGYEGVFPTEKTRNTHPSIIDSYIDMVKYSPHRLRRLGCALPLPEKIGVLIAEDLHPEYVGTYIKHPNREGFYLISAADRESLYKSPFFDEVYDPKKFVYSYQQGDGILPLQDFSRVGVADPEPIPNLDVVLKEVISWHDRIAFLAEMDPNWSYQIEFGINPTCLFQVRPFRPFQKADFKLRPNKEKGGQPLVIGVTPKEGIVVRVEQLSRTRLEEKALVNDGQPLLFIEGLRHINSAPRLANNRVTFMDTAQGIFAHEDIAAARHVDVAAYFSNGFYLRHGQWVRVISDGRNLQVKRTRSNPT